MDKTEFKNLLLEGMCRCAKEIDLYYLIGHSLSGVFFCNQEYPEPFNPGVADKFIFNKILDNVIDNIFEEYKNPKNRHTFSMMGANIMAKFYYPYYGNWRTLDREKVRGII